MYLQAIRDWLHEIPYSAGGVEARRGYAPYTKNKLKQLRRTGAKAPQGLVDRLDPDALVRARAEDEGARMEADDAVRLWTFALQQRSRSAKADLRDKPPPSHTSELSCAACTSMYELVSSPKRSMPAGNRISRGELRLFRADSSGLIRCWGPRKMASKMTRWSVRAWSTEF